MFIAMEKGGNKNTFLTYVRAKEVPISFSLPVEELNNMRLLTLCSEWFLLLLVLSHGGH
jgi:hypothetical protein